MVVVSKQVAMGGEQLAELPVVARSAMVNVPDEPLRFALWFLFWL
jgi:hypothetical protein